MIKKQNIKGHLAGAILSGFGLSLGADIWKGTRKRIGPLIFWAILISALILPYLAARDLIKGHDRGLLRTLFLTVIGNCILGILGLALTAAIYLYVGLVFAQSNFDIWEYSVHFFIYAGAPLIIGGLIHGLLIRRRRLALISVAKDNLAFLRSINLAATHGKDITHMDHHGNSLRLMEDLPNQTIFMVVGKKGKRAMIEKDDDGRYISYSGISGS